MIISHESMSNRCYIDDSGTLFLIGIFEYDKETNVVNIDGIWYWLPFVEETGRYWPNAPRIYRPTQQPVTGVNWSRQCQKWKAIIPIKGKNKHIKNSSNYDDAVLHRVTTEQCLGLPKNTTAYKYTMGVTGQSLPEPAYSVFVDILAMPPVPLLNPIVEPVGVIPTPVVRNNYI